MAITKEERLKRGREYKRKKYYTDSVYREKRLKESEKHRNNPESRESILKYKKEWNRKKRSDPEYKANELKNNRKRSSDPNYKVSRKKTRNKNWVKALLQRVLNKDKECDLNHEYILKLFEKQKGKCFWFGFKMIDCLNDRHPLQPSLDRIDNNKGYTKDNVVLCCLAANYGKNSSSVEHFLECIYVLKLRKKSEFKMFIFEKNENFLKKRYKKNWINNLIINSRSIAKRRNLEFNLDDNFLQELNKKQKEMCYWYGCKIVNSDKIKYGLQYSLDRIDSKKGYTKDNVVLCCLMANLGKNKTDPEIWKEFCEMVRSKTKQNV